MAKTGGYLIKCPQCGLQNRADARFCRQCGHSLHQQAIPPPPTAIPGTICPACGATAKPEARFCPRCGKPLAVQPAPQPFPPTPASTQPSMRPISPPAPTPHQSPPPVQPPYQSPPPPPPVSAERRSSRWMRWVVVAIALLSVVAVALIAVLFGPELIGGGGKEASTATPAPTLAASATAEPTPLPTATPTSEPPTPTPTPTAEPSPIPAFDAQVTIATSAVELRVGDPLTITVALTNTGSVALSNLLYQLVGEPTPGLEWTSQDVVQYEGDISAGAAGVVTFTLRASQEGNAALQAYVRMDAHTDPASAESLLSEMLTVLIAPP